MGESKGCPWNFNIIKLPNLPCFTYDQLQIDSIQGRENKTSSKFQNKNIKDKEHEHLWILVFTDCRGPSTNPPWVPRDSRTFFLIFLTGMFNIWNVSNIPKKKISYLRLVFNYFRHFFLHLLISPIVCPCEALTVVVYAMLVVKIVLRPNVKVWRGPLYTRYFAVYTNYCQ